MKIMQLVSRWWRSWGHGIQSPSAYQFVRYVLCERDEYYAYSDIAEFAKKNGVELAYCCFLFRLANFWQADRAYVPRGKQLYRLPIGKGCRKTEVVDVLFEKGGVGGRSIVVVDKLVDDLDGFLSCFSPREVLLVENIGSDKRMALMWAEIVSSEKTVRTYDVKGFGIAFFETGRLKEHFDVMLL